MARRFDHQPDDTIHFGPAPEVWMASALKARGASRILLLAQARHREGADRLAAAFGPGAQLFSGVTRQVPPDVVAAAQSEAQAHGAQWLVAHGGGSAVGVAKAVALDLGLPVAAVPTTYAGSERTGIWGRIDAKGQKHTGRNPQARPRLVAYDPALVAALPTPLALKSLLNALAHSVEALYAAEATPAAWEAALESLAPLWRGLQGLADGGAGAAADGLYGAYLAGTALDGAQMALHHKLAHVLGGEFGTPHADTHAALLPHTLGWNLPAAPAALAALRQAWGVTDPAAALHGWMRRHELPTGLKALGIDRAALPTVAARAAAAPYPNPRPMDEAAFRTLLAGAWHDRRPGLDLGRAPGPKAGTHQEPMATAGDLDHAPVAVLVVAGRGSTSDHWLARLRGVADGAGVAWLAPQATGNTWYPKGFLAPLAENQPALDDALATLDAAWARLTAGRAAAQVAVAGFSQGACLLLSWLASRGHRPGATLAFSGAALRLPGDFGGLAGAPVYLSRAEDDPWIPADRFEETVAALKAAGARVHAHTEPDAPHQLHPADRAALRRHLEALMQTDLDYQTGFGNALRSEARPGAIPARQNGPKPAPYGLFAEQINGTGFTVQRAHNRRTWVYRLRPAIHHNGFAAMASPPAGFTSAFDDAVPTPEALRYAAAPPPAGDTDWLDGVQTFAGAGHPSIRRGMAVHLWGATRDMERVFANIDGDLLLAPYEGTLGVRTELGWLRVSQGEIAIIPRGMRFQIKLPGGPARGFMAELFEAHFQLPERGPVGANGMADERHFKAPVASYEDRPEPTPIVVKQGGQFFETTAPYSPFDVVGWHGTWAPFKYDLRDFNSLGSVSFDHPDPSILTVLTSPMDATGRNAIDVGVFLGRWDVTEHTFRPPYYHRNSAIEFNAVISTPSNTGPYQTGAFSYTPYLTPHGVSATGHARAMAASDAPSRVPDDSIWLQFESTYLLGVLPKWLDAGNRDQGFLAQFDGWQTGELVG